MRTMLPALLLTMLAACSAPDRPADATDAAATPPEPTPAPTPSTPAPDAGNAQAGWYMEHGATGMLQPCSQDVHLTVDSAELRQRARDFGLAPGTPVYVRVSGTTEGSRFTVARVAQFGSPEPVSDCPMTGTMTQ